MKTAERHQLKHNEVADTLQDVVGRIESNRKTLFAAIVAILVVGGAAAAMMYVSGQKNDKASAMLADAVAVTEAQVVPPIAGVPGQPPPPPPPAGSFPSGHALNLTAIFGFLLYLAYLHLPAGWPRRLVIALLALPIATIGLARVYAGAHWPSDALGGYLLGFLWLALTIHLYRWARHHLARRRKPTALPTSAAS